MATRTDKTDSLAKLNEGMFDFSQHARNLDRADLFAPIDLRGSASQLRSFLEKEIQVRSASGTATSMTLVPGKLYLRQQPCGLWNLTHNRGRGTFDCYTSESREKLLELAEEIQNQSGR